MFPRISSTSLSSHFLSFHIGSFRLYPASHLMNSFYGCLSLSLRPSDLRRRCFLPLSVDSGFELFVTLVSGNQSVHKRSVPSRPSFEKTCDSALRCECLLHRKPEFPLFLLSSCSPASLPPYDPSSPLTESQSWLLQS